MTGLATIDKRPNLHYEITNPDTGITYECPKKGWRFEKSNMVNKVNEKRIIWPSFDTGRPRQKIFIDEMENLFKNVSTLITHTSTSKGTREINSIFEEGYFDFPKPSNYLSFLYKLASTEDDIILDFFSGSATTAHAVLNLNKEDNGNRKYILVQLPEPTDEKSEAHKAGYATIAEIGKERIRRVVKKIKEEEPEKAKDMDLGFRVFKLDSSNIEAWDPDPDKLEDNLFSDNIKADRTEHDLVYEILLKYGLDLSLPITERSGPDKRHTLYAVGGGALFLCLGAGITRRAGEAILAWAEEIGAVNPKVVFRDTGFTSSVEKTNAYEVLRSGGVTDVKSV